MSYSKLDSQDHLRVRVSFAVRCVEESSNFSCHAASGHKALMGIWWNKEYSIN